MLLHNALHPLMFLIDLTLGVRWASVHLRSLLKNSPTSLSHRPCAWSHPLQLGQHIAGAVSEKANVLAEEGAATSPSGSGSPDERPTDHRFAG